MNRMLPVLGLLAASCTPKINIEVLRPAAVMSPPEVKELTVVDRSRAKNAGQTVLGVLEGALTGEAIGADRNGRSRAMTAVVTGLRDSPRFDAAESFAQKKELESNLFDKELSWETADKICAQSGCQGIVALEAFDSDSSLDISSSRRKETVDGKEVTRTVWEAQRFTKVVTAWRYYDVVNRRILDDLRTWDRSYTWTETGDTKREAINRLPNQTFTVEYVGELAGTGYAQRIAPSYIWVVRDYYGGGHDELKLAKNSVRALDWADASRIWTGLHGSAPDPKIKGKAAYNLALAAEVQGDLDTAIQWATEAAKLLSNSRARTYRGVLQRRKSDEARLAEQMDTGEQPLAVPPR